MYRIVINPKTGNWEVQLLRFFLFWCKIAQMEYQLLDTAVAEVSRIGIDRIYKCWNSRPTIAASAAAYHNQEV